MQTGHQHVILILKKVNQINSQSKIAGTSFEAVQSPYQIIRGFSPGVFSCNGNFVIFILKF
jgi:hypothetical protein